LQSIDLSSAKFSGGADFRGAKFSKKADFSEAEFSAETDFISAEFSGGAVFTSAKFSGKADFTSAKFSGEADFSSTFNDKAYFNNALFEDGKKILFGSKFSFMNTDITRVRFSDRAKWGKEDKFKVT
jgi:uncharacterized protein YjbI with pentapeptide repeats